MPAGTYDQMARYLTHGFWDFWGDGWGWRSFDDGGPGTTVITYNVSDLTTAGQRLARAAMQTWEAVADIDFRPAAGGFAQLRFDDAEDGAFAGPDSMTGHLVETASVNVGPDFMAAGTTLDSDAYGAFIHEIGHALGLGHMGPYDAGTDEPPYDTIFSNDTTSLSVMSYIFPDEPGVSDPGTFAWKFTPMMVDIIAIQNLYGAPRGGPTAGDTTWGKGMATDTLIGRFFAAASGENAEPLLRRGEPVRLAIFDEGGQDRLDLSFDDRRQRIDLRPEAFSDWDGGVRNLSIARGTVIEGFVAGSGGDSVTGNRAANQLHGRQGDDRLLGQAGNDHLLGGRGDDRLGGDWGRDRLEGGYGDDRLDGGTGNDVLLGGGGRDSFVMRDGADHDTVRDFRDDVDTLRLDDALWGGGRTARQVVAGAQAEGGDLVFRWGDDSLTIRGLTRAGLLLDDLVIV